MLKGNIRTQIYPFLVLNGVALDIAAVFFQLMIMLHIDKTLVALCAGRVGVTSPESTHYTQSLVTTSNDAPSDTPEREIVAFSSYLKSYPLFLH